MVKSIGSITIEEYTNKFYTINLNIIGDFDIVMDESISRYIKINEVVNYYNESSDEISKYIKISDDKKK